MPFVFPHDDVVDDDVVVHAGIDDPNTKTITLGRVTISTQPVRTEPVATSGIRQSYAAARCAVVSVSNRDVGFEVVVRSTAGDADPRQAIRRHRDFAHENAGAPPVIWMLWPRKRCMMPGPRMSTARWPEIAMPCSFAVSRRRIPSPGQPVR